MAIVEIQGVKIGKGMPKICVPLVGETNQELIAQAMKASQCDCDLVELRIDHYEEIKKTDRVIEVLHRIRECVSVPIMFTFRTYEEGGKVCISNEDYTNLYQNVIEDGAVDLVDLQLLLGEEMVCPLIEMAKQKGIKVVLSNHDFKKTPDTKEMIERLLRMQEFGADIVKIAVMPEEKQDVLRLMEAVMYVNENSNITPVVGISMGEMGMPSRILGHWFGSAITFGVVDKSSAPGQLSIKELRQLLELQKDN